MKAPHETDFRQASEAALGFMIYNKIEWVLVITKLIFNYYNPNFSLEITSKVEKVNPKYTFTHKLTTKRNFSGAIFIF